MQVDPIKPNLKAPGSKRLKLKYDEPLSNFAFNFNLRRYIEAEDARILTDMSLMRRMYGRGLHPCTFQLNLSRF